ncbi:copper homeostasis protein CutC [Georgenia halophila]|uniref:PF03932 family protein CutC n=1 Tax=Georgenia halophila TaxID=620889 RepID=A0ABP8LMG5_9MICO
MTAFELAVQDVAGVRIARALGVDRIELCTALGTGGLTPSRALIDAAVAAGTPVHVLIRPRAGDFSYSAEEQRLIVADARVAVDAGAQGVVVGATCGDVVDADFVRAVLDVAPEVTFHRAFDTVADRDRALEVLIELGVRRVLTSGGAARAVEALDELAHLVRYAGGALEVMAGSGITPANALRVAATGVPSVHGSAKHRVAGTMPFALGSADEAGYETTDEEAAREILTALRQGQAR